MEFTYGTITNIQDKEDKNPSPKPPSSPSPSSSASHQWASHSSSPSAIEHMFEKVVTPSDVGKLNRLVIPKQHAERYFPLDPQSNSSGGLLLNFEEHLTGKPWRFRYSYWNSSQSYVMTKGWSRFVKDKRLDPGDTVSFSRGPEGRLFIDWRRRPLPPPPVVPTSSGWTTSSNFLFTPAPPPLYYRAPQILESVPVVSHRRRQVRLFGVNIEEEQPPSPLQWRLSTSVQSSQVRSVDELQLMPPTMEEG